MLRPLHPNDGVEYYKAMTEAQELYLEWEMGKVRRGITIQSRKEQDDED